MVAKAWWPLRISESWFRLWARKRFTRSLITSTSIVFRAFIGNQSTSPQETRKSFFDLFYLFLQGKNLWTPDQISSGILHYSRLGFGTQAKKTLYSQKSIIQSYTRFFITENINAGICFYLKNIFHYFPLELAIIKNKIMQTRTKMSMGFILSLSIIILITHYRKVEKSASKKNQQQLPTRYYSARK